MTQATAVQNPTWFICEFGGVLLGKKNIILSIARSSFPFEKVGLKIAKLRKWPFICGCCRVARGDPVAGEDECIYVCSLPFHETSDCG